jgi:hypothetical protein
LSNFGEFGVGEGTDLVKADFKNCIIDGNSMSELMLSSNLNNIFNFSFQNCLIKYSASGSESSSNDLYDFDGPAFENILLNGDSDFFDPKQNDFRIGLDSDAINKGSIPFAQQVPFDLLNRERISAPDLGVYQATFRLE